MAAPVAENRPLADLLDTLGRTADGMVAVDGDLRIVAWNEAATELLGFTEEEVLGRHCWEVLGWRDRYGNAVCDGSCAASEPGDEDEIMATREVIGHTAAGNTLWLNATAVVPRPDLRREARVVHLVREVALPLELERLVAERLSGSTNGDDDIGAALLDSLTPRQLEVLRLLSDGLSGTAIAEHLYLSTATVRNHIQHILDKLEVHSRVEAVALYLRAGR